jgi:hypothetical protein
MPPLPSTIRPASGWINVLAQLEATLERSLAEAAEPGPTLFEPQAPPLGRNPMARLDARLASLHQALDQAEGDAKQVDAALVTAADDLREWAGTSSLVRLRLAEWSTRTL